MNASIALYARVDLMPRTDDRVLFQADDVGQVFEGPMSEALESLDAPLLHKGVYSRFMQMFNDGEPLPLTIRTSVEAPMGSGLGSSSALVVALVEAFRAYFRAPMGEYDLAQMAFVIERRDLGLAGGRQDHYSAAFGGFNFMEFRPGDVTIVNPLRMREDVQRELESAIVLFYFGQARESAAVIREQQANMTDQKSPAVEALHQLRKEAHDIKDALLKGDVKAFAETLNRGWESKKRTAQNVSNERIDTLIKGAHANGAIAAKVSGAGGGGFLLLVADPMERTRLQRYLESQSGIILPCRFTPQGAHSWRA